MRSGAVIVQRAAALLLILAAGALIAGLGVFTTVAITKGVAETGRFAFALSVAIPVGPLITGFLARSNGSRRFERFDRWRLSSRIGARPDSPVEVKTTA